MLQLRYYNKPSWITNVFFLIRKQFWVRFYCRGNKLMFHWTRNQTIHIGRKMYKPLNYRQFSRTWFIFETDRNKRTHVLPYNAQMNIDCVRACIKSKDVIKINKSKTKKKTLGLLKNVVTVLCLDGVKKSVLVRDWWNVIFYWCQGKRGIQN